MKKNSKANDRRLKVTKKTLDFSFKEINRKKVLL